MDCHWGSDRAAEAGKKKQMPIQFRAQQSAFPSCYSPHDVISARCMIQIAQQLNNIYWMIFDITNIFPLRA